MLTSAGFTLTTVDQEIVTQDYKDAFVLMRDLRGMGESNAGVIYITTIASTLRSYLNRFAASPFHASVYYDVSGVHLPRNVWK